MTAVGTGPTMATDVDQLAAAMSPMAQVYPDIHSQIVAGMARAMSTDGVVEFTLSELAKDSGVRLGLVKDYMAVARESKILELLGRRTDNGRIRYCAYQSHTNSGETS